LLLELKGKLGADIALPAHAASDAQADILQGWSRSATATRKRRRR